MKITKKISALLLAVMLIFAVPFETRAAVVTSVGQDTVVQQEETADAAENGMITMEENLKYASNTANDIWFSKEMKIHTGGGENHSWWFSVYNLPKTGKITKVTISNKKIASVEKNETNVIVRPKKAGKATVKVTVKYGSTKKTFSSKLTVYNYINPVRSYKVNGKEIKKQFNKTEFAVKQTFKKNQNVKLQLTPKSGWKVTSFTYYYDNGKSKRYTGNSANVVMKRSGSIQINITNNKTGLIENLVMYVTVK